MGNGRQFTKCVDTWGYRETLLSPSSDAQFVSLSPSLQLSCHVNTSLTHLHYGVDRTRLLTEPAVDALCHVNVVSRRSSASVRPCLCLDCYRLGRTNGLAQLARDTPLLSVGIPPQGVFPTETRADRSLLEGVVEGGGLAEEGTQGHAQSSEKLREKESGGVSVHDRFGVHCSFVDVDRDVLCGRGQGRSQLTNMIEQLNIK